MYTHLEKKIKSKPKIQKYNIPCSYILVPCVIAKYSVHYFRETVNQKAFWYFTYQCTKSSIYWISFVRKLRYLSAENYLFSQFYYNHLNKFYE